METPHHPTRLVIRTAGYEFHYSDANRFEAMFIDSVCEVLAFISGETDRPAEIEMIPGADLLHYHFADEVDAEYSFTTIPFGLFKDEWKARRLLRAKAIAA